MKLDDKIGKTGLYGSFNAPPTGIRALALSRSKHR